MNGLLKMSDAAALGLHAVTVLAAFPNRKISSRQLASILDVSENHLAKVMQKLARNELVKSTRGPNGGFQLNGSPGDITMLQVYEAIEGPLAQTGCLLGHPRCKGDSCIMGALLEEIHEKTYTYFNSTTLEQLARAVDNPENAL